VGNVLSRKRKIDIDKLIDRKQTYRETCRQHTDKRIHVQRERKKKGMQKIGEKNKRKDTDIWKERDRLRGIMGYEKETSRG
jgi:hypothetical protein